MSLKYEFDLTTRPDPTSEVDIIPAALAGTVFWYDTGTTHNSEIVYTDALEQYIYWNVPFVGWAITVPQDLGENPDDYFGLGVGDVLTGYSSFAGKLLLNECTISNAWYLAETTAFESFRNFVGATEGVECFRGFLPVMGDGEVDRLVNAWQFSSGDSDGFNIDRLKGEHPSWCSLRGDAQFESLWETREMAMRFSGAVLAWLQSTNNLKEMGNVTWCTLAEIPAEPVIHRTTGRLNRERYWRQTIDLELLYRTGMKYN